MNDKQKATTHIVSSAKRRGVSCVCVSNKAFGVLALGRLWMDANNNIFCDYGI